VTRGVDLRARVADHVRASERAEHEKEHPNVGPVVERETRKERELDVAVYRRVEQRTHRRSAAVFSGELTISCVAHGGEGRYERGGSEVTGREQRSRGEPKNEGGRRDSVRRNPEPPQRRRDRHEQRVKGVHSRGSDECDAAVLLDAFVPLERALSVRPKHGQGEHEERRDERECELQIHDRFSFVGSPRDG
jgi:hypothetical protein